MKLTLMRIFSRAEITRKDIDIGLLLHERDCDHSAIYKMSNKSTVNHRTATRDHGPQWQSYENSSL